MDMVEKVARALHEAEFEKTGPALSWDELPDETTSFGNGKETCRRFARAAIAAMREPTEAMIEAGCKVTKWDMPDPIWRAMIDAALESKKAPGTA